MLKQALLGADVEAPRRQEEAPLVWPKTCRVLQAPVWLLLPLQAQACGGPCRLETPKTPPATDESCMPLGGLLLHAPGCQSE